MSGRLAVSELTLKDFIKHYMDRCGAMAKPSQLLYWNLITDLSG